jgi:hypothetical protein
VALDYYGAKYFLYPLSNAKYHNPDAPESSVRKFLELALDVIGEGTLEENNMKVHTYDYKEV